MIPRAIFIFKISFISLTMGKNNSNMQARCDNIRAYNAPYITEIFASSSSFP